MPANKRNNQIIILDNELLLKFSFLPQISFSSTELLESESSHQRIDFWAPSRNGCALRKRLAVLITTLLSFTGHLWPLPHSCTWWLFRSVCILLTQKEMICYYPKDAVFAGTWEHIPRVYVFWLASVIGSVCSEICKTRPRLSSTESWFIYDGSQNHTHTVLLDRQWIGDKDGMSWSWS